MSSLELKIPPPIVALVTFPLMWGLSNLLPRVSVSVESRIPVAVCIALLGIGFAIAGAAAFRQALTTLSPLHPEQVSSLVTSGILRISRNPMYVGLLLLLLAWAVALASPISLAGPGLFIAYINRFQITPEELILAAKFGREYADYKSRVRRWI